MVFQPNAVLGNAPKNPRFILLKTDSAPSGPNTAEVEKALYLLSFYLYNESTLSYLIDKLTKC
jgi:hypothetical protein